MRDRLDELGDASVAAVTFAAPVDNAAHRAHLELSFPVLADPDRAVYAAFDLGRASFREIWNLDTGQIGRAS